MLHTRYYQDYGLAIEGLVRHHKVDPLEYNRLVDDALPLDEVLKPNLQLKAFLLDLDTQKVKPWLLTNAYVTHARRVIKLLDLEECFEGVTYCDYAKMPFLCKPAKAMYEKAEHEAGVRSEDRASERVFFVGRLVLVCSIHVLIESADDSNINCTHAQEHGWTTIHLLEPGEKEPPPLTCKHRVGSLLALRKLFPDFFKSTSSSPSHHR